LFTTLWAITKNSFTEVTRQPIYGILVLAGMALIAFSPSITAYTMMEDVKLVIDMGLGTILMVGIVLAVLSASQVVSREVETRTAGAVLSKPVGRFVFILGKFLGVALAMVLAGYLLTVILVMTVRMGVPTTASFTMDVPVFLGQAVPFLLTIGLAVYANYFYRWNFPATAVLIALPTYTLALFALFFVSKEWVFEWIATSFMVEHCDQVGLACGLVVMGVLVVAALAVAASTRLNVVSNVLVCLAVFFVGMVSQYLFGWSVDYSATTWAPSPGERMVMISGRVLDGEGRGLTGVRVSGLPGRPLTGRDGSYRAEVKYASSGTVKPSAGDYAFSPASREYTNLTDDAKQDYVGVPYDAGVAGYLSTAGTALGWAAYHVVPSFQLFWVADQLIRPEPYIPLHYVGMAVLYAVVWCAAMVALAAFLFEKREIV